MIKSLIACVFILFGVLACAATNLPPVEDMPSLQLQMDERRLWNRSEEEQRRLDNSNYLYDDPTLTAYVNDVAQGLIPEDIKAKGLSIQVRVIKNPLLNAFAYPNGVIYVHTGILCKMQNEAQLATLLGHEMTHVTYRHGIENYRSYKNATAVLATVQVASIPFGVYGSLANVLGSVGAMAAVSGYSRELETEADQVGLDVMVKAGYDPAESPRLFEFLKKDIEEQNIREPFFFGTHPRLQERIYNYNRFIGARYADKKGLKHEDRFMAKITPLLLDNALLDLSMGRFRSAQNGIDRFLKIEPNSARGHYCMAEVFRQKGKPEDREKSIREYNLAINCDPSFPKPHKGLGKIYYKQKRYEEARLEFERYLSLNPEAEDRGYIEQYIKQVNTKLQEAQQ